MVLAKMLIRVNCVLFLAFGLAFVFAPAALAALVTGAVPATASAMTDMRATYGGMALGLAAMFGLCAGSVRCVRLGSQGVLAVMLGLALARALGMVLDGGPNAFMWVLLVAEIGMAALAWIALRQIAAALD